MEKFRAYKVFKEEKKLHGEFVDIEKPEIDKGEVLIRATWSGVNYKDALGATGAGAILKKFPLIPGIDVAGEIVASAGSHYKQGDKVLVTGCGLGEIADGGFSELVKVPEDWVIKLPENLSEKKSMIFGTAGFTAALCLHRMELNGQDPSKGPIVVTGASGGVGSFAVSMFASKGYEVIAVTGKQSRSDFIKSLGATEVISPDDLDLGVRPLEKARYGGVVDNVGGELLGGLLRHIELWGNVASVGVAGGAPFDATVFPMILRGVSLLGISSANCPMELRRIIWDRLSNDLMPESIEKIVANEVSLSEIEPVFHEMLERKTVGRTLVRLQ